MLMKCPKCGFVQPEDQFCARCGVDVKSYQIKPQPWYQRVLSSPSLWILLFAITTYLVFEYLRQERLQELEARSEYLTARPKYINTKEVSTDDDVTNGRSSNGQDSNLNNLESASISSDDLSRPTVDPSLSESGDSESRKAELDMESAKNKLKEGVGDAMGNQFSTKGSQVRDMAAQLSESDSRPESDESATKESLKQDENEDNPAIKNVVVQINYYEVEEAAIQKALGMASAKSNMVVDFGDIRYAPLWVEPNVTQWTRLKGKKLVFNREQPGLRWNEGLQEPDLGFIFGLALQELKYPIAASLEWIKLLPDEGSLEPLPTSFPNMTFEVTPKQRRWFISARLPRSVNKEAIRLLNDPVFNFLTSDSFRNRKSEFTIVLSFETQ